VPLLRASPAGHIVYLRKGAAKPDNRQSFLFLFNGIARENGAREPEGKEEIL